MIVKVSSRHMEVTDSLRTYAEQKAGKLIKYFDRIREIEVICDAGKDRMNVEMVVNADHTRQFVASHELSDAYACIDQCVDKLERQLHEHKDQHRNRKHLAGEDKHTRG
ncbi:MAG: ribosome hibernation-promoting factor, HPF/YfiA family [Tepidisphaerales bacterium]